MHEESLSVSTPDRLQQTRVCDDVTGRRFCAFGTAGLRPDHHDRYQGARGR